MIKAVLLDLDDTLLRIDTDAFVKNYLDSLAAFIADHYRALSLDVVKRAGLSEIDWEHPARHSIFGPPTLLEMAHFTARHDRLHISQLCQTLGQC